LSPHGPDRLKKIFRIYSGDIFDGTYTAGNGLVKQKIFSIYILKIFSQRGAPSPAAVFLFDKPP
jgi:hypothetical protein